MSFLDELFGAVKREVGARGDVVTSVVMPWGRRLMSDGLVKMVAVLELRKMCAVANVVAPGHYGDCPEQAAVLCAACAKPCCLSHAFLSNQAHAVCWVCIDKMLRTQRATGGPAPEDFRSSARDAPPREQQQQRPGQRSDEAEIADAFATLGLEPNAMESEMKAAFRILSKKYHPDRVSPEKASKAEAKMKRLSHAYHLLLKHYERRKAA